MRKRKNIWGILFPGILLVLSCAVLGKALVAECSLLNGDYSMQKVLVSVRNQIDREGRNSFSMEDVNRLKEELSTEEINRIAQSGLVHTPVTAGSTTLPVRLTGTDHKYPMFNRLTLEEGSFFTQKHEEEGAMVAVIDSQLAREIFNTLNVAGKTFDLYGSVFTITGVVKKDTSILGKLTDDGLPDVYIPASVMLELDTTAAITTLQIKTDHASTPDVNTDMVSSALRQTGKDPSSYKIDDYNLKLVLMEQLPFIYVFILGILSILILLAHVKNLLIKLFVRIKNGCRTDYFSNVIKCNKGILGACLLETALAFTGIALIWAGIRFKLYIPPEYIPDELINVSYYSDLIKAKIQDGMQNMGYVAPYPELTVNTVSLLLNLLCLLSAILGSLLLYMGFREIKKAAEIDTSIMTVVLGLFFILSLAVLAAAAFLAGLPYAPDMKSTLVVWFFIFLNLLTAQKGPFLCPLI